MMLKIVSFPAYIIGYVCAYIQCGFIAGWVKALEKIRDR